MSENLNLVRAICGDWERGRFSSADWAHPEIEFVAADGTEPGTWTGLARLADVARSLLIAGEDVGVHVDEYRELDHERVLVLLRSGDGRGGTGGTEKWIAPLGVPPALPVRWREMRPDPHIHSGEGAALFHIRDGKVSRLVVYRDRTRALAELGLKE